MLTPCPACEGEGYVDGDEIGRCHETGGVDYEREPCGYCHGRGGFGCVEMAVVTGTEEAAE